MLYSLVFVQFQAVFGTYCCSSVSKPVLSPLTMLVQFETHSAHILRPGLTLPREVISLLAPWAHKINPDFQIPGLLKERIRREPRTCHGPHNLNMWYVLYFPPLERHGPRSKISSVLTTLSISYDHRRLFVKHEFLRSMSSATQTSFSGSWNIGVRRRSRQVPIS